MKSGHRPTTNWDLFAKSRSTSSIRRTRRSTAGHRNAAGRVKGIGACAKLYSAAQPGRIANPSEFFSWLYFTARGRGVSQQTLQALEHQTRAWLKDWSPIDAQKVDSISVGRTRYAFDARRQERAASEYEFALKSAPEEPAELRVTQWEQALRWPALVWMEIFLGVESSDEN